MKICITTLSDSKITSVYTENTARDFTQVLEETWENRVHYAEKHGYTLYNASNLVDSTRPASWFKILAVKEAFRNGCDWVFWMDSDSLIMNSEIRLEDILPSELDKDFVLAIDLKGYNAGMWMLRKSKWSTDFLDNWWSKTEYIREPGDVRPGDNIALKQMFKLKEIDMKHVLIAPQCSFNSYYCPNFKKTVEEMEKQWYWSQGDYLWMLGIYVNGDFVLHFAGLNDKQSLIGKFRDKTT